MALVLAMVAVMSIPDDADARKQRQATTNTVVCTGDTSCEGTDGNDTIYGTDDTEIIDAKGGSDRVYGRDGNDSLAGDSDFFPGEDRFPPGSQTLLDGNDVVLGGPGGDSITGNGGSDVLSGDDGNDAIFAAELSLRPGRDYVFGGRGDDHILQANDGYFDYIDCGEGTDTVNGFDEGLDFVASNCENKNAIPTD